MIKNNDAPVHVSADERKHPAIRLLARACIAIARQQIEAEQANQADQATGIGENAEQIQQGGSDA